MQLWRPDVSHTHEHGALIIPLRGKTHVVKVVGDELQIPEGVDLAPGEFNAEKVDVVSDDGGLW
jgi:hypothetical protein